MTQPPPHPSAKPHSSRDDALAVLRRLHQANFTAYFAGGCVRDLLLGLTPGDYDIATNATPHDLQQLFRRTQAVGQAFGVILVKHRLSTIEVATFRSDHSYSDGRRPDHVSFTTPEQDAQRRDFTINGLFLNPLTNQVIDYVSGQQDLQSHQIRAIGSPADRFAEDHLRLLRAVRFAARFNFTIEPATASAIQQHAHLLVRISPERIADELRRMLTPLSRHLAFPLLWHFHLIHPVFRFLQPPPSSLPTINPSRSLFLSLSPPEPLPFSLALAAASLCYLLQSAPPQTDPRLFLTRPQIHSLARALRQSLRISNEESDDLQAILQGAAHLLTDTPPTLAAKKRFLARPTSPQSLSLLRRLRARNHHPSLIDPLLSDLPVLQQTDYAPPPLITGDDLTAAGLSPSPLFRRLLDATYDAQLEHQLTTKSQALQFALRLAQSPSDPQAP